MPTDHNELSKVSPISDLYVLSEQAVDKEVDRVLDELTEFIHDLLPVMAARDPDTFSELPSGAGPPTLREWQDATIRLRSILNTVDSSEGPPVLDRSEFDYFHFDGNWPQPAFDFAIENGRVRWQLCWSIGLGWLDAAGHGTRVPKECRPSGVNDIERSIEATKQWLLACSVRDRRMHDGLREVLSAIADRDPEFAKSIVDVENWRERISTNHGLTDTEREMELARLNGQFRFELHEAVQNVITALANNHFMEIRRYLQHSEYEGRSSWSTLRQLFAILLAKVEILMDVRRHVREAASKKDLTVTADGFAAIGAQAAAKLAQDEAAKPPQPDWDHSDPRWREFTYLDYIEHKSAEAQERELWQVLRPRFAPDQPNDFAEFDGCSAHLNLNALDLNEDRQRALRVGLAGSGVRVPGTKFVLRVARPWCAYFEVREGEFPALPHNWMEGLHLLKGGWEDEYEWIGRRHDWYETVVHWNRYEETPSGWRLKPRPAIQLSDAEWQTEIDRVIGQITGLIDNLLPAIAKRDPDIFTAHLEPDSHGWTKKLRTIDEWTSAASRLRGILKAKLTPLPRALNPSEFNRFTWGEPSIDYTVENSQIHWRISCYGDVDWLSAAHTMFRGRFGWPPTDDSHPGHSVEATKRWLMAGSTDDIAYYNDYISLLAALADGEPEFVKGMLDPDVWRERIESKPVLSDDERECQPKKLTAPIPGGLFRRVIHNALLHVTGALANNRFDEIRPYIDHPEFAGSYTPLVPHYLFANLLAKVHTIQKHGPNRRLLG